MEFLKDKISRRQFLKGAVATAAVAAAGPKLISAGYTPFKSDSLEVWTCGGLSEAFCKSTMHMKQKQAITFSTPVLMRGHWVNLC